MLRMRRQVREFFHRFFFKPIQAFCLVPIASRACKSIATSSRSRGGLGPCSPTGGGSSCVFQDDAIDRTHRQTQLATSAIGFDDSVHALVAADYGVGWTDRYAQRTPDAPVLIYKCNTSRRFCAVFRVEWFESPPGYLGQACDALASPGGAQVQLGIALCQRAGIACAICIAAACALCLRQRVQYV